MAILEAKWFRNSLKVIASIAIIAAGSVTLYVFGQKPEIETLDNSGDGDGVLVKTVAVAAYEEPVEIVVDGEATTYRRVEMNSEVAGQIEFKSDDSRSGHYVKEGELLFKIDDDNYQIALESQKAQLEQIDEEIRAINVDLDNLSTLITLANEEVQVQQEYLERTRRLYERNATTETELDNAETKELAARNSLQKLKNEAAAKEQAKRTAQARLKVAEVALKKAQLDLDRCTIKAPITGRVIDDVVEQGNFVSVGQTLTYLSDSSQMEVRCQLQPSEVAWIWEQQIQLYQQAGKQNTAREDPIELQPLPCEIVFEFGGVETIWDGTLTRFAGTGVSRETRTFPARVVVKNPEETRVRTKSGATVTISAPTLLSGMFVEVRIPVTPAQPLISLPSEAIRPGGRVWVADEENKLNIVEVTVARVVNGMSLIRPNTDLKPGDQVIVSPIPAVVEGMPVREFEESPAQAEPAMDSATDATKLGEQA